MDLKKMKCLVLAIAKIYYKASPLNASKAFWDEFLSVLEEFFFFLQEAKELG